MISGEYQPKGGKELENNTVKIGKRAFISAVIILACLIVVAGILTYLVPAGTFQREIVDGREVVIPDTFVYVEAPGYPFWRWLTAPLEVLWGPDSLMVISIMAFIMIIGGSFAALDNAGVLLAAIQKIVEVVGERKYLLLALITLFFMLFGSFLGIFEEIVPLVPLAIVLALSLGWDSLTGLGMSLLATAFGFSAAIANPFTIGVAQKIAGLPTFSGFGYRTFVFILTYFLLLAFLLYHAKKVEKNPQASLVWQEDEKNRSQTGRSDLEAGEVKKAPLFWFGASLIGVILVIVIASLVPGLADFTMPLVALMFLAGGLGAGFLAGQEGVMKAFWRGILNILPGVILIMMAMSVKFIIAQGGIMDTILYYAANTISKASAAGAALLTYGVVLILNFFIGSATAKAFLVMPLITPLADLVGVARQVAVLAFAFGDGFSNVLYPTNPVLLIALGLTVVSYPKWLRWVIALQLAVLVLSSLLLLLAVGINWGPF